MTSRQRRATTLHSALSTMPSRGIGRLPDVSEEEAPLRSAGS
jgi:hypothetical protein